MRAPFGSCSLSRRTVGLDRAKAHAVTQNSGMSQLRHQGDRPLHDVRGDVGFRLQIPVPFGVRPTDDDVEAVVRRLLLTDRS